MNDLVEVDRAFHRPHREDAHVPHEPDPPALPVLGAALPGHRVVQGERVLVILFLSKDLAALLERFLVQLDVLDGHPLGVAVRAVTLQLVLVVVVEILRRTDGVNY